MSAPARTFKVSADKARVHQIVFNLLHNAIKYTPPGGRIWLQCTAEADHAVIKVEDTGVGIAPSLLPRIFELFTQEDPHQSGGGFGVGLSLVKDLVDAHRGFVEVRCDGKHRGASSRSGCRFARFSIAPKNEGRDWTQALDYAECQLPKPTRR